MRVDERDVGARTGRRITRATRHSEAKRPRIPSHRAQAERVDSDQQKGRSQQLGSLVRSRRTRSWAKTSLRPYDLRDHHRVPLAQRTATLRRRLRATRRCANLDPIVVVRCRMRGVIRIVSACPQGVLHWQSGRIIVVMIRMFVTMLMTIVMRMAASSRHQSAGVLVVRQVQRHDERLHDQANRHQHSEELRERRVACSRESHSGWRALSVSSLRRLTTLRLSRVAIQGGVSRASESGAAPCCPTADNDPRRCRYCPLSSASAGPPAARGARRDASRWQAAHGCRARPSSACRPR